MKTIELISFAGAAVLFLLGLFYLPFLVNSDGSPLPGDVIFTFYYSYSDDLRKFSFARDIHSFVSVSATGYVVSLALYLIMIFAIKFRGRAIIFCLGIAVSVGSLAILQIALSEMKSDTAAFGTAWHAIYVSNAVLLLSYTMTRLKNETN